MSKQNNKAPTATVGAYVPKDLSSFIAMYAICTGQAKSAVIRNVLNEWRGKQSYQVTGMVDILTEMIQSHWYQEKYRQGQTNDIDKRFEKYLAKQRQNLIGKKVSEDIVQQIINRIKK